ncbi:MAG: hypothetical protein CM15mP22_7950 [Gammaproteobacteria bacterium]|nr:MAG: hypothetical protein CM15mP22_7950 [Gammaproteobacteria bacterium]
MKKNINAAKNNLKIKKIGVGARFFVFEGHVEKAWNQPFLKIPYEISPFLKKMGIKNTDRRTFIAGREFANFFGK